MKKKFNIVFIPTCSEINDALYKISGDLINYADIKANYQLRPGVSYPHVTVFQFELACEKDHPKLFSDLLKIKLNEIWLDVFFISNNRHYKNNLSVKIDNEIHFKYDAGGFFAGTHWCELLIKKDINPFIVDFHHSILKEMEKHSLVCLNANGKNYHPHFTLFNTKEECKKVVSPHVLTEMASRQIDLTVAIGEANDQWELIRFVHSCHSEEQRCDNRQSPRKS